MSSLFTAIPAAQAPVVLSLSTDAALPPSAEIATPYGVLDALGAGVGLPVMAFVPLQRLSEESTVYEPEVGFGIGTLFPALNKPWRVRYE